MSKFKEKFLKKKNDLFNNNNINIILYIYKEIFNELETKTNFSFKSFTKSNSKKELIDYINACHNLLSEFDSSFYYGLEQGLIEGYKFATGKDKKLNQKNQDFLIELGLEIAEEFEGKNIFTTIHSKQSLQYINELHGCIDQKAAILMVSIEFGFFYGYSLSKKPVHKIKTKPIFLLKDIKVKTA